MQLLKMICRREREERQNMSRRFDRICLISCFEVNSLFDRLMNISLLDVRDPPHRFSADLQMNTIH